MIKKNRLHYTTHLKEIFSFDLRSLALFRIGLSLLILYDLAVRSLTLRMHYTDFGLLPRAPLIEKFSSEWVVSIHYLSGAFAVQLVLFIIAALFALMLLVGYRTRLATFLSWFMMISLQQRNPMILQAGDVFFRMQLFWGMFLPLGARFSIDSLITAPGPSIKEARPKNTSSVATVAFFFQVAFIYWFTAAIKLAPNSFPIWWTEGSAIYYALSIDQFVKPFGQFLLGLPLFWLKAMTRAVILVEIFGPFFLFSPVFNSLMRLLGVMLFVLLHVGFKLSLELGPFPLVSSVAMVPFLPALLWDKCLPKISNLDSIKDSIRSLWPWKSYVPKAYFAPPLSQNLLALFFLVYVLFWNLGTVNFPYRIPQNLKWLGIMSGLEQKWNMFSPPLREDGWYVIPAKLKNGKQVDLFKNGGPVSWQKPASVYETYRNERERKYMMNIWLAINKDYRLYYGKYLCRSWNRSHSPEEQINEFEVCFMKELTLPNGQLSAPEKKVIWHHYCFDVPT